MGAGEFFELVQTIRRRIQDVYIHDTLSEAIAVELERDYGFIYVSDDRLVASVNVSTDDDENFLAELEVELADAEEDETTMTTTTSRGDSLDLDDRNRQDGHRRTDRRSVRPRASPLGL